MSDKLGCMTTTHLLAGTAALCAIATAHAVIIESQLKLTGPDPQNFDFYGDAVDLDGTTMVVTAPGRDDAGDRLGAAYILDAFSGYLHSTWLPDPDTDLLLMGGVAAISGPYTLIGRPIAVNNTSGATLFDAFTGQPIVAALSLPIQGTGFGHDVAVHGTTALIATPFPASFADDYPGSVGIYDARLGGLIYTLTPDDGEDEDYFGRSVAIHGNLGLIGSTGVSGGGAAYVFDVTNGRQRHKLIPPDPYGNKQVGWSVAMSGTVGVVGAPTGYGDRAGIAYVYDLLTGELISTLEPRDGQDNDQFGHSVDISGKLVIVGAPFARIGGAAYLFDAVTGTQLAKLLPSDPEPVETFGKSVAIDGARAVVGCPGDSEFGSARGAIYLFNLHELADICRGDLSDDGRVDIADLNIVLDHWNETPGAYMNGDVDGDGNVNAADLNAILAAWGACS